MSDIDPIDPTPIAPGLAVVPMAPTVWDDLPDGQYALAPNGTIWRRRHGLWRLAPWWQGTSADEIRSICADPGGWDYDGGWPRHLVERAAGALELVALPGMYPHDDSQCRQDSVDADAFREAARALVRLSEALGVSDTGNSAAEVVDAAIVRLATDKGPGIATDTPRPERVTLSDGEREALTVDAMECGPWHYHAEGVLCSCGRPVDATDDTCAIQRNVIDAVERILAAREQALREEIAGIVTAHRATVSSRLTLADALTEWLAR